MHAGLLRTRMPCCLRAHRRRRALYELQKSTRVHAALRVGQDRGQQGPRLEVHGDLAAGRSCTLRQHSFHSVQRAQRHLPGRVLLRAAGMHTA
jgi:hypothetical protein